jgi:hypothetical protein
MSAGVAQTRGPDTGGTGSQVKVQLAPVQLLISPGVL